MPPETQVVVNIALAVVSAVLGWYLKVIHQSMRDLQEQDKVLADKVQSIEVLVAGTYVKRTELDQCFERMVGIIAPRLDRIEQKLDGKMDRV